MLLKTYPLVSSIASALSSGMTPETSTPMKVRKPQANWPLVMIPHAALLSLGDLIHLPASWRGVSFVLVGLL